MSFSSIQNRFTIDGAPDATNPTGTAFYNQALQALQQIYDGSPSAAVAVDAWLASHLDNIKVQFVAGAAQAYAGLGIIQIDPAFFTSNYYISTTGNAVQDTFVSGLAHELSHAVTGKMDNESFSNLSGDNVLNANTWFSELGFAPQSSYEAYDIGATILNPNFQYTQGASISNALIDRGTGIYTPLGIYTWSFDLTSLGVTGSTLIVGGSQNNLYVGTTSRDWIYGQAGEDSLNGGGGDDFLYGGADNDILMGGAGSDEIWGGEAGNDQGASDGVDKVDYSSNFNFQPIIINFQGTSTSSSITVNDGLGGVDTLYSIENIIGTTGYDVLKISGQISSATQLTVNANGGQSPNAVGSIINGAPSTTAFNVSIDAAGNGSVQSIGGGSINLTGFHTQVVGTDYDDTISDDSAGEKRIGGGYGDDTISTAGTSDDVVIYGGAGADTITGGSGNDLIVGDTSLSNSFDAHNVLNGGDGDDHIVSTSYSDTIDGGDGDDYLDLRYESSNEFLITNNLSITGGTGNDYIETHTLYSDVNVNFGTGDGHDSLVVPQGRWSNNALQQTIIILHMGGLTWDDVTLVVDAEPNSGFYYRGFADVAVVIKATGDSIYIPHQYVYVKETTDFSPYAYLDISIDGSDSRNADVTFGSVDQYKTDLSAFNSTTAPSPEDTTGGDGDDTLSGGDGDDTLTGGAGNDNFTTSMGNDTVDGGDGSDTVMIFGRLSDFTITRDTSSFTLTDTTGREGSVTATSIERVFSVTDGESYTMEDLFGHYGTDSDDVINATDVDNRIYGLGGNDTLNGLGGNDTIDGGEGDDTVHGGDGNDVIYAGAGNDVIDGGSGNNTIDGGVGDDVVIFSGASGDYNAYFAPDGSLHVENDQGPSDLQNIETLYFESDDITVAVADIQIFNGTAGSDAFDLTTGFVVTGGLGDDHYTVTGDGAGVFNFAKGDGHDELDQPDYGVRSDTLILTDVSSDDVSVSRLDDSATFTVDDTGDTFTAVWQFFGDEPDGVPQGFGEVQFADGVTWDRNEIFNRTAINEIAVDSSNPYRTGSDAFETFVIGSGLGEGVIDNFSATGANHDYLQFDRSQFDDWAHLLGATVQQGSDLVINLDANDSVRLTGVSMSAFTSLDVRFVGSVPV